MEEINALVDNECVNPLPTSAGVAPQRGPGTRQLASWTADDKHPEEARRKPGGRAVVPRVREVRLASCPPAGSSA